jgi:hypothetical protein
MEKWEQAVVEEHNHMLENGVWTAVPRKDSGCCHGLMIT